MLRKFAYIIFIASSVTISYFLGEGDKNMLLIGLMAITPLLLIFSRLKFDSVEVLMLLFVVVLLAVDMMHPSSFRLSSFIYTACFVTTFLFLRHAIDSGSFHLETTISLLKVLIYAYTIVLVLQQLSVATGIPMINPGPVYEDNPWKLASLAPEPSHLVRFMFFIMYAYVELRSIQINNIYNKYYIKQDRWVWLSYFWVMLTCYSTTGFILTLFIFTKFIKKGNIVKYGVLSAIVIIVMNAIFADNEAFSRIQKLGAALLSFDFETINYADHSAAARIVPYFAFFQYFNFTPSWLFIGEGMDVGKHLCQNVMAVASNDGSYIENDVNVGGISAFIIDTGVIPITLLIVALQKFFKSIDNRYLIAIWYFITFMNGINKQMFWSSLILLYLVSYFTRIYKEQQYISND